MPPQVRRRPLGPPSAITTGVSQRRSGGGLEGAGNSILSAAISQLLSGSDGDGVLAATSPVPASRFLAQSRDTIGEDVESIPDTLERRRRLRSL